MPTIRTTLLMAALCLPAAGLLPGEAGAFARFDFEQPYFVEEPGVQCKDHALLSEGGVYHIYYIHSFPRLPGEPLRSEKWLGHLTGPDLKHWTRQDSILPVVEVPDSWEDCYVWAPKVLADPFGAGWLMFYTGVTIDVTQQCGGARSDDLFTWTRLPENPLYRPGPWSNWAEGTWANCRDPEIFRHLSVPYWYMINTASMADGRGALSMAGSADLLDWSDQGPLLVNSSTAVLESPQLVHANGLYHLFFTEQWVQGTSHITAPTLWGNWSKENLSVIDAGNAPEISRVGDTDIFSRHDAIDSPDGPLYYFRFDAIDFDTPDNVPRIDYLGGLGEQWCVVFGSAFDNQPTFGDNPRQRGDGPSNMEGNSYLATYEDFPVPVWGEQGGIQGNQVVGLLISQPFVLTGDRMRLLVGGGNLPELCFVALLENDTGRLRFIETGEDSYAMSLRLWNLETLLGRSCRLVVADLAFREWGHISTDGIEEYQRAGSDPIVAADPLDPGPLFVDVLEAAGYGPTAALPAPAQAPPAARLLEPQPNPFNPRSYLRYELARPGRARLSIHDAAGRTLRVLLDEALPAGPGFCVWDGRDAAGRPAASGVYLARLSLDGDPADPRKLVLIR